MLSFGLWFLISGSGAFTREEVERQGSHSTIRRSRQTGNTFFLRRLLPWQKTSRNARAFRGPPMQRKASLPAHSGTNHKKSKSFDRKYRTLQEYSRL